MFHTITLRSRRPLNRLTLLTIAALAAIAPGCGSQETIEPDTTAETGSKSASDRQNLPTRKSYVEYSDGRVTIRSDGSLQLAVLEQLAEQFGFEMGAGRTTARPISLQIERVSVIDAIATDHAPHEPHHKELPFDEAPCGMLGLETALALAITELDMPLAEILRLLSWQPARVAGTSDTHGGPVEVGRPANLTVIDPTATWVVDGGAMASLSSNTPFEGRTLTGRVRHTVVRGEAVVLDGEAQR